MNFAQHNYTPPKTKTLPWDKERASGFKEYELTPLVKDASPKPDLYQGKLLHNLQF